MSRLLRSSALLLSLMVALARPGIAAPPPVPSPCSASDAGPSVILSWPDVPGAIGYHIFRDGLLLGTVFSPAHSYTDVPHDGMVHTYCIDAYNVSGSSECCDQGVRTELDPIASCTLAGHFYSNAMTWTAVAGASGYSIFRDGVFLSSTTATSYADNSPLDGTHEYCVQADAPPLHSALCCHSVATLPATPSCKATTDLAGIIRVQWSDGAIETGYRLFKDHQLYAQLAANETTFVDSTIGGHTYCVEAFNDAGKSAQGCSVGTGLQYPVAPMRLSWGTCSPQVPDQTFTGPGIYTLVLSGFGAPQTIIGHDSQLTIRGPIPDAWRFDDGGCQGEGRLTLTTEAVSGCPALLGANPLAITSYFLDTVQGTAGLRLAVVFDDLATDPRTRYVLWKIAFDHSHSRVGTDADSTTCDGAEQPVAFDVSTQYLLKIGYTIQGSLSSDDAPVTWNGAPVRTIPMTWGRLKGLYR